MKKIIYISLWFALAFASCVKEPVEPSLPNAVDGLVRIELFTDAGDYQAPVTRSGSADENGVGFTPWIIVFEGTGDGAQFREAAQATVIGGRSYVALTPNANPCRLLIVANAPATFYNGTAEVAFAQAQLDAFFRAYPAFADATDRFATARLAVPRQTTVPYVGTNLPMTALCDVPSITQSTSIGTSDAKVFLGRAVARVSVTAQSVSNFTLLSAGMVNAPRNGVFYRQGAALRDNAGNLTEYLGTSTNPTADIAPATLGTTAANPIYVYEERGDENPSVIIRGSWNGVLYYYRLAFKDAAGRPTDVLRNKSYQFTITDVPAGAGYLVLSDAINNPPANIRYTIAVTDQTSAEIADNGIYFVGLSNSDFRILDNAAYTNVVAFTVSTNATAADAGALNSITLTSPSGPAFTISPAAVNLAATPGDIATTEVRLTIPAYNSFSSIATVVVRIGNITRNVSLTRLPSLSAIVPPVSIFSDVVSGTVASQGNGGEGWLSLTLDRTGNTPGSESLVVPTPGLMCIALSDNIAVTGGVARIGGEVWLSRANGNGRSKILIGQQVSNMSDQPSIVSGYFPYAGAFWRWNQSGERLVSQLYYNGSGGGGSNDGKWTAKVIRGDFIVLDDTPTQDPGVTYDAATQSPADMSLPTNDAKYRVEGCKTSVSGTLVAAQGSYIRLRIGLTGTLPSVESTPRYGVVVVAYANYTRYAYIFVRQGEAPDYVMRPTDAINSGGMVSATRPLARRFTPFNLTDPQKGAGRVDRGTRGYGFTDYPTQAGYYFQWGGTAAWYPAGDAASWTSVAPAGYWDDSSQRESCPAGYHRPGDGSTSSDVFVTNVPIATSELRQSLWLDPVSNFGVQPRVYTLWGYYADGWFDRRATTDADRTTVGTGAGIAYAGRIFYNPGNFASLFFPAQGSRTYSQGALSATGSSLQYWTTARSVNGTPPAVNYMNGTLTTCSLNGTSALSQNINAMPIRCVKDE